MSNETGQMEARRILIVEDEEGIAIHLDFLLKRINCIGLGSIAYGEEAIERASVLHPDLILMDINLAGKMDGIEAARLINEQHDIPIIFLTALSQDDNIRSAQRSHPYAYLVKPVKEPDLHAAIEVALYKHKMEASLKESEQRYRLLFDKMNNGSCLGEVVFDSDGCPIDLRFLALNTAFETMVKVKAGDLVGCTLQEAFPDFDAQYLISTLGRVALTGDSINFEYYLITSECYLSVTAYSPKSGQFALVTEDISERRQVQQALQKSEEQLRESYHRLERGLRQMSILRSIDQVITTCTDYVSMASAIMEDVASPGDVDAAVLFIPNMPAAGRVRGTGPLGLLRMAGMVGFPESAVDSSVINWQTMLATQVYHTLQPIYITNIQKENHPGAGTLHQTTGFSICAVLPLISRHQVKGVFEFFLRQTNELDNDWRTFLQSLALQTTIGFDHVEMLENLKRSNRELALAYDETIKGWALALELREKEDRGHAERVASLSVRLAAALGYAGESLDNIRRGAFLHDIGKMAVPDNVLYKTGPLNPEEWVTMRKHPTDGYRILSDIDYLRPALDVVYNHHEKWDGSGYPRGLRGEEIPLSARIFAVVDVWDAITNDRPYRPAWSIADAQAYMMQQTGKHFDPRVIDVFLKIV
jgi:putative nucleotidyltransferase with HDIG domain